jgi:hypothetical protein
MLASDDLKSAALEERFDILLAEIREVAGDIETVPVFAQQEKLPARSVGHLNDQSAFGAEQFSRAPEITLGFVQMLEYVEHGDCGAALVGQRSLFERSAHGGNSIPPGHGGGLRRRIQTEYANGALLQEAQEQPAAASDVKD